MTWERDKTMNTNTQNGGYNDNRNGNDMHNFGGGVVVGIGTARFRRIRNVIIETTKWGFNMFAKFYIATRNAINNNRGSATLFETMIVMIMLAVVAIVVSTLFMGVCDNVGMSGSIGGMLGIN